MAGRRLPPIVEAAVLVEGDCDDTVPCETPSRMTFAEASKSVFRAGDQLGSAMNGAPLVVPIPTEKTGPAASESRRQT